MTEEETIVKLDGKLYDIVNRWEEPDMKGFIDIRVVLKPIPTGHICRECYPAEPCILIGIHHSELPCPKKKFEDWFGRIIND